MSNDNLTYQLMKRLARGEKLTHLDFENESRALIA